MTHAHPALQPATAIVALGRPDQLPGASLVVPPELTSTYAAGAPTSYGRQGNPTWSAFEEIVGALEGGRALVFASGMAAVDAVLHGVPVGARIVAPAGVYNGVDSILRSGEATKRWRVEWVDITDTEAIAAAVVGADLLWLESPTNPLLEVADLAAACAAGRAAGATIAVDNTFATPLSQRPLELGADIVVHSATKYLSGHSDVVLGVLVVAAADAQRLAALHLRRTLGGGIPGPMEVFLATRGLRTLAVRWDRACRNAAILAARLGRHEHVERVRYPGFGAMISIEVRGGAHGAAAICQASRLISHSTSLGGVETQWERRRAIANEPSTTPENLVRISVGIEDVEDIWADLTQALTSVEPQP
ncbi:trans-sulfuration enzyme family protein [Nostocoides sp.]|uniref:trans-sulfuration enzyme family protein n=1 Tax=Nostocoides sp. TaxID=1917966 RepID=UPI002BC6D928|nr:PLP-dependent transferase [Tetrasphaera sp.]